MKNILALRELDNVKIQNRKPFPSLPSVLIDSHNRNQDTGCPTCQNQEGNDNVEDFRRTPYSVDKTE